MTASISNNKREWGKIYEEYKQLKKLMKTQVKSLLKDNVTFVPFYLLFLRCICVLLK